MDDEFAFEVGKLPPTKVLRGSHGVGQEFALRLGLSLWDRVRWRGCLSNEEIMRILILSQYYLPEPEPIPHELATGLAERGHEVTVATGFPNYPYGRIFAGHKQSVCKTEFIDGVKVLRFPLYPDRSRSIWGRCLYYLSLAFSSTLFGPLLCNGIDVIFLYHPITLAIPAFWIGLWRRAPFVINIQDMYPESLSAIKIADRRLALQLIGKFASFMYKKSSAIAVISPGFKQNLLRKGVRSDKIHVILNWANERIYFPVGRDDGLAKQYSLQGRFNIVYAGNMGPPQGLQTVLEAARLVDNIPEIQFALIGDGMEKLTLENIVRKEKINNVIFLPRQPAPRISSFLALADVLIVHLIDDPLFEITIPSKIQSYLAFGRPILAAVKGDAADLVRQAGAGVAAQPSNPRDIANAVIKLYGLSNRERAMMGEAGRRFFLQHLTMRAGVDKYESLLRQVVGKRRLETRGAITTRNGG